MIFKQLTNLTLCLFFILITINLKSQITFYDSLKVFEFIEYTDPKSGFKTNDILNKSHLEYESLGELLQNNSSVYIKQYGFGALSSLSIRGMGASQTQIIWEGLNLNSSTLGQTDLSLIPTFFTNTVKIQYGGASLINGLGGSGGNVLLGTNSTFNNMNKYSLEYDFGSFNSKAYKIKALLGRNKWWSDTRIIIRSSNNNFEYLDNNHEKQIQRHNESTQRGILENFNLILSNRWLFSVKLWYLYTDRNLPPPIDISNFTENQKDENLKSLVRFTYNHNKIEHSLQLSYQNDKMKYENIQSDIQSDVTTQSFQFLYNSKLSFKSYNLLFNYILKADEAKSDGFGGSKSQFINSLLGRLNRKIGKLDISASLRAELNNSSSILPALSLGYYHSKVLKSSLNYSMNYRPPTLNDKYWQPGGNPDLKAENNVMFEYSLNYNKESKNKFTSASIGAFCSNTDNWIQWQPSSQGYWRPKNLRKVKSMGIETDIKTTLTLFKKIFNLNLSYSFIDSRNRESEILNDNSIDKLLIYSPQHKVHFSISTTIKKINITYNQIYQSKTYIDASNSIYLPHYIPANFSISRLFNFKKVELPIKLQIFNLYNEPYQVVSNRPMPGINYKISIGLKL